MGTDNAVVLAARGQPRHFETVAELVDAYLSRTRDQQSPRAFLERQALLRRFVAGLAVQKISDLISDDLELWIEQNTQWRSDWTRLRVCATVKRVFNWALRKGLIASNVFSGVSHRQGEAGNVLSEEHFRAFLRGANAGLRRVLFFLSWTGARPCEMEALQWSFIDWEASTATFLVHKTSKTRKDRKPRVLYLPKKAVRLLLWIRRGQRPDEPYCFLNSIDRPWNRNSFSLRMYRLKEKLGLQGVRTYGTRHAFATKLAETADLVTVSVLLGHTNTKTSERYIHAADNNKRLRDMLERGLS